jgi:hypothetical protein
MRVTEKPSHTFSFLSHLHIPLPIIKCQSQTFTSVIVDLKKPNGRSPASSYVQPSRAKTRARLSILRPFDPAELRADLSKQILMELEWQTQKAKETEALYL